MTRIRLLVFTVLAVLLTAAACGTVVKRQAPTIAHIHIGHAITSWPETPGRVGLLVLAETRSVAAQTHGELLQQAARNSDMAEAARQLDGLRKAIEPLQVDSEEKNGWGLRRAAAEAMTHLQLASEMKDASVNVQRSVAAAGVHAEQIIGRSDELIGYMEVAEGTQSPAELELISEEISLLLSKIAGGTDDENVYGIAELRRDVESMVEREDPPYETVEQFYLFNLVKLPNGDWGFSSRSGRGAAGPGY